MLESTNHHFATITIRIGSGQNHKWILNIGGKLPTIGRQNLHIILIKRPPLFVQLEVSTDFYTDVATTKIKIRNISISSKFLRAPLQSTHPHHPQSLAIDNAFFYQTLVLLDVSFTFSRISHKWNHTEPILCLVSFSEHNSFEIHPFCCHSFFNYCVVFHGMSML